MSKLTDYVVFNDQKLASRFERGRIPMTTLFEAYLAGDIDIPDMDAFLDARDGLVTYTLTMDHVKQLFVHLIPEVTIHSKKQDTRIVREHYDRGDDFFEAFLGDRMVYTAGFFHDESETLEQAQYNKMDNVCRKLMVSSSWQRDARHRMRLGHRPRCTPRRTTARARRASPSRRRR